METSGYVQNFLGNLTLAEFYKSLLPLTDLYVASRPPCCTHVDEQCDKLVMTMDTSLPY